MNKPASSGRSLVTIGTVFATWWPLAASWLLMGFELPAVSAFMARLADPTISLAAYGGVVFPLCLLIESPIIMLLTASTALSTDWKSYALVRSFMWVAGCGITVFHVILAFTPLYYVVVEGILGVPQEIVEPSRLGLMIMTPWSLAIAYRRFQQGVLIRYGHTREVGLGTGVRLAANITVLIAGYLYGNIPGIVVGSLAVAVGVVAEAIYIGFRVQPVLQNRLRHEPDPKQPLTWGRFARFYAPLSITPLIMFLSMPMASAAMSRMPDPVASLAAWPVVSGLVFTLRSVSFGFNEVVVSFLERPGAVTALRRFATLLAISTSLVLLLLAATPAGRFWFGDLSALDANLIAISSIALWLSVLLPGITAFQSLYQGTIIHSRKARGVTESMVIYVVVQGVILLWGIWLQNYNGLYVTMGAQTIGNAVMAVWLWYRARPIIFRLQARENNLRAALSLEASPT